MRIAWADNNGIPRSRIIPITGLARAATRGVGVTTLFAVFDTHDAITDAHPGLDTPTGDVRLVPVVERLRRLAGQPAPAWAPGRQVAADGSPWPYCQRGVVERAVAEAARKGYELRAGHELEFAVAPANGLGLNQLPAEYGLAQLELSLSATDPLAAADDQLPARQAIHAAAHARLPTTPAEQDAALVASKRLGERLGEELLGAFRAVRSSEVKWAAERSTEEIIAAHRWRC